MTAKASTLVIKTPALVAPVKANVVAFGTVGMSFWTRPNSLIFTGGPHNWRPPCENGQTGLTPGPWGCGNETLPQTK
jgi:hypothetical protein